MRMLGIAIATITVGLIGESWPYSICFWLKEFECSIYTITLGAVDRNGRHVTDSSPCTAVMAAAYSSNAEYTSRIVRPTPSCSHSSNLTCFKFSLNIGTDESCYDYFGGTSAAAAAASGIFALALEANPNLTWRDIEYLVVETSKFIGNDWTAVAGRKYNEKLGFGVLDIWFEGHRSRYLSRPRLHIRRRLSWPSDGGRSRHRQTGRQRRGARRRRAALPGCSSRGTPAPDPPDAV